MSKIRLTLADVCEFIGGSQPPKTEFSDIELPGYVRLVQTRDFKTDVFLTFIPKKSTKKFFSKSDIMIGRYGPPIFQIFRGLEGAYNVALLKAKPRENILNDYLYYFLKQDRIFQYVDKLSPRTGGQTGVDLVSLNKYPIDLPDLQTQQKIAAVLSSLDDKILLNNKINTELEAMAKTLYDYWFVQFDFPNAEGKPYKSSGGEIIYDEALKREIPKIWKVRPLKDISHFKNGKGIKNSDFDKNGLYNVWGSNGVVGRTNLLLFSKPVVAIGRVGANYGEVHYSINPCWISDNAVTAQPSKEIYFWWLIDTLKRINYKNISGGSAQPLITQGQLKELKFPMPNDGIFNKFHNIVNPLYSKLNTNNEQNQELASLRDWLLPMLMNGQVTINDSCLSDIFEKTVESVSDMKRSNA